MNANVRNLLVATLLAVMAMVLTLSYINSQKAAIKAGQERTTILVAADDIAAGTTVTELREGDLLKETSVLKDDAVEGAMDTTALDDLEETDAVKETVLAGHPITTRNFDAETKLPASDRLRGTARWIAVPAGNVQNVAQHVRPGDRIDIFAVGALKNYANPEEDERPASWVAARDVLVVETPQSRTLKLGESEVKPVEGKDPEGPTAESGAADAPAGIYVLQVTDKVAMEIYYAMRVGESANGQSGEGNLFFALRGKEGATQTNLPPNIVLPNVK